MIDASHAMLTVLIRAMPCHWYVGMCMYNSPYPESSLLTKFVPRSMAAVDSAGRNPWPALRSQPRWRVAETWTVPHTSPSRGTWLQMDRLHSWFFLCNKNFFWLSRCNHFFVNDSINAMPVIRNYDFTLFRSAKWVFSSCFHFPFLAITCTDSRDLKIVSRYSYAIMRKFAIFHFDGIPCTAPRCANRSHTVKLSIISSEEWNFALSFIIGFFNAPDFAFQHKFQTTLFVHGSSLLPKKQLFGSGMPKENSLSCNFVNAKSRIFFTDATHWIGRLYARNFSLKLSDWLSLSATKIIGNSNVIFWARRIDTGKLRVAKLSIPRMLFSHEYTEIKRWTKSAGSKITR